MGMPLREFNTAIENCCYYLSKMEIVHRYVSLLEGRRILSAVGGKLTLRHRERFRKSVASKENEPSI